MREVLEKVAVAAELPGGVLISGEPGTGRHLVAREVHRQGMGASAPFERVDCRRNAIERVEQLQRLDAGQSGTLFLAHLEALSAQCQWRLARLLDEGRLALRPVASTGAWAANGGSQTFRLDLWQRVAGVRIEIPPLRERRDDILPLATAFMESASAALGVEPRSFDASARTLLLALPWHGNAAELRCLVEHLAAHARASDIAVDEVLSAVSLDGWLQGSGAIPTLRAATRHFEHDYIIAAMNLHEGRVSETAAALGLQRPNLYRKMRALGIPPKATRFD